MKKALIWLIAVAVLLIVFVVYRSHSADRLDVDPNAAREIERAKHR